MRKEKPRVAIISNPLARIEQRLSQYGSRRRGLTQTEQELMPYVQEAQEKRRREVNLLQPLEVIFDLLQRGQYFSANVTQQILNNYRQGRPLFENVPEEAWQGLLGKKKGDWEQVLFGKQGFRPWEPETKGGKFVKGVAGFAANVAFDPTSWFGFGVAKGARTAATKYADDVVRLTARAIGKNADEVFPKLIQKGFDPATFGKKFTQNVSEGLSYMSRYGGDDLVRHLNKIQKKAYKKGLRKPGKELADELLQELQKEQTQILSKALPTKEVVKYGTKPRLTQVEEWIKHLKGEPYKLAGTRTARFMRKEFATSERYPQYLQKLDQARELFQQSKIGGLFSDAWWAIANNPKSPVHHLRKLLHIRNPYQKVLSVLERDIAAETSQSMVLKGERIFNILEPLNDAERKAVTGAMIGSQVAQEMGQPFNAAQILSRYVPENQIEKLTKVVDQINGLTGEWLDYSREVFAEGLTKSIGEWEDYLPIQKQAQTFRRSGTVLGASYPGFTAKRKMGWSKHIQEQVEKIKWMFGLDEEMAQRALSEGVGDINVDLQDMLMRRAFAQTRFEQHINMVKQFREFGFNVESLREINPQVYHALTGARGSLEPLGLRPIQAKGFEGYLFDREVAEVLERASKITSNDQSLKALAQSLGAFTSWWRGWATLSPGFHMRNFFSNNLTGLLKHGLAWLNPETHVEAIVGTVIGLNGREKGIKMLSKILPETKILDLLSRRIGKQTLEEAARRATAVGVITRMSKGFIEPQNFDEFVRQQGKLWKGFNPLSQDFIGMRASRKLGGYVESVARFQSFLIDYKDVMRRGGADEAAFNWAKTEARKWFIDYGDLSEFEKKVMRNIMPFYTWLRGNIANQITGMIQFKEMYSMIPKATKAATTGLEKEQIPDWMRELGMFSVGEAEGRPIMFWPNFPYQDINRIPIMFEMSDEGIPMPTMRKPGEVVKELATQAHPLIKSVIEYAGETDLFYQTKLGETRKAPRLMRVLNKTPKALAFLDGLMRTVGFEEGLRIDQNDKGQLLIDAKISKILDNNILLLQRIPQFADPITTLIPAIRDWKNNVAGFKDDYQGLEAFFQILSFYAGIKMKQIPEDYMEREAEDILREAEKQRQKDRRKLPGYQSRRLNYMTQRMMKRRRLGL